MKWLYSYVVVVVFLFVLFGAGEEARATTTHRTVRLLVHVFCTQDASSNDLCGRSWTMKQLQDRLNQEVGRTNLGFAGSGISFAPEIDYQQDPVLAAFTGSTFNGGKYRESAEYAAFREITIQEPTAAHWIMTESHSSSNWSSWNSFAIWVSPGFDGGKIMHELGHYLGTEHTFTKQDGCSVPA